VKNPPFTLRQAQGERREHLNDSYKSVRGELVEPFETLFQQPVKIKSPLFYARLSGFFGTILPSFFLKNGT
jgi:hypothetical protein